MATATYKSFSNAKEIWEHLRKLCISAESATTLNLVGDAVNRHPALITLTVRNCALRLVYWLKDPAHERCLLHEAVAVGNLRTAAVLLRHGADPKKTDRTGRAAAEPHELNVRSSL